MPRAHMGVGPGYSFGNSYGNNNGYSYSYNGRTTDNVVVSVR